MDKVEFFNPYTKVTLSFPLETVKKAVSFVLETSGVSNLDDALFNCWQLSSLFSEEERQLLSLVQTIVSGTKDGFIRPEDFDIYALAEELAG